MYVIPSITERSRMYYYITKEFHINFYNLISSKCLSLRFYLIRQYANHAIARPGCLSPIRCQTRQRMPIFSVYISNGCVKVSTNLVSQPSTGNSRQTISSHLPDRQNILSIPNFCTLYININITSLF